MPVQVGFCRLLIFIVATGACASPDSPHRGVDTPERRASAATAVAGIPLEHLVADCPVDSTARHDDPLALVEEFVRRDAEGPFEREDLASAWYASALSCVERATSDHYEVIRRFQVSAGAQGRDSAVVFVTRERLYYPRYDEEGGITGLDPVPGTWVDTVLVVRTTLGWRIHEVHGGAHRLPAVARGELRHLEPVYRRALEDLASRPGV